MKCISFELMANHDDVSAFALQSDPPWYLSIMESIKLMLDTENGPFRGGERGVTI